MRTKRPLGLFLIGCWTALMVPLGIRAVQAQDDQSPGSIVFTQEELDQLLAPIALYPDELLAQVLMAATYPLEVVEAARFAQSSPLQGSSLARAVESQPWDDSVKSLLPFPSVLAMMSDALEWTQKLGDAFLNQQAQVMDTVQALRARAQANGNLVPSDQEQIVSDQGMIEIEPVDPLVISVPYYDPTVVFGPWWWPHHRPRYWQPPPRFRPPHWRPGGGIFFGIGTGIGHGFFRPTRPDWRQHQVTIDMQPRERPAGSRPPTFWQHDPDHRRGVAYRDTPTRDRFQKIDPTQVRNRDPYRGREVPQGPISRPTVKLPPPPPSRPDNALRPIAPRDAVKVESDRGRISREAAARPAPRAVERPPAPPPRPRERPPKPPGSSSR